MSSPPTLVVRPRRAGDRIEPFGGCARTVKHLLIAQGPRWDRGRVPVVEASGRILGWRASVAAPPRR